MPDSISGASDSELLALAQQIVSVLTSNPGAYGLTATQVSTLDSKTNLFDAGLTGHLTKQADAQAATTFKNAKREDVEVLIRSYRNIAKAAGTDQMLMDQLGIPTSSATVPPNATVPVATVGTAERLRHLISWTDRDSPDNKRKPRGAMGAEIWVKLDGPPPTDEKQCSFLALDGATPYLAEYPGTDAGKTAHYLMRGRMRDGSLGAWGETISATITG